MATDFSELHLLERAIAVQKDISNTYSEQFWIEMPVRDRTNPAVRESKLAKGL